ncbi:hypothetical protein M2325_000747 [Methanococcus voltae PS]|uniref:Uncharacterized protein n=1 Tax=Methanococcus voltae PS TaxID=523842 RepID=A0ABT2EVU6_METVO|nr:hypothetical protein [Methanococcus voltae]MCS3922062.1 hypothetical protein [Methanococcus voltae PS]
MEYERAYHECDSKCAKREDYKENFISFLTKNIFQIRDEIGLEILNFSILDYEFKKVDNVNNNGKIILYLYTSTRTDKSGIIGPGGWVIGKLREKIVNSNELLNYLIDTYNYSINDNKNIDKFRKNYNKEIIIKKINNSRKLRKLDEIKIRNMESKIISKGKSKNRAKNTLNYELFKNLIIRVEDISDIEKLHKKTKESIIFLEKRGLDFSKFESKFSDKSLYIIQCEYDLAGLNSVSKYFNIDCATIDTGNTVILPHKSKSKINEYIETYNLSNNKNLNHNYIQMEKIESEEIISAINDNPCIKLCNRYLFTLLDHCKREGYKNLIFNHFMTDFDKINNVNIVNFLSLFPIKKNTLINSADFLECPMVIQACKNNETYKFEKIDEIVEKVYGGVVEPTEGSEEILKYLK